jgi:hypothetical protein
MIEARIRTDRDAGASGDRTRTYISPPNSVATIYAKPSRLFAGQNKRTARRQLVDQAEGAACCGPLTVTLRSVTKPVAIE